MAGYLQVRRADERLPQRLSRLEENAEWSTSDKPELKVHRIHAYPAKFPAFIATKAINYAQKKKLAVKKVADVFCGCGTVAFEARRNSIDFWGCDINPVATLIARTKSNSYQAKRLQDYEAAILMAYTRAPHQVGLSRKAKSRLRYWYSDHKLRSLGKLLNAINEIVPSRSPYRTFFHCAFSNILKPTSRWLTKSIKPQIDPEKKPAKVLHAFRHQCAQMIKAQSETKLTAGSTNQILCANVLDIEPLPKDIDVLVSSPPYVTSYEYADLHQLSALWLGYTEDYRELRNGSIGTTQHSLTFSRPPRGLNTVANEIVYSLYDRDKATARSAAKYFIDMQNVAKRSFQLLRKEGIAVFVIGNTEYHGIRVNNAAHLIESFLAAGFAQVRVAKRKMSQKILTPYRDKRGKFTRSNSGRHVYAEEFVLIASK